MEDFSGTVPQRISAEGDPGMAPRNSSPQPPRQPEIQSPAEGKGWLNERHGSEEGETKVRRGMSVSETVSEQPLGSPTMSLAGVPPPSMTAFSNTQGPNPSKLTEGELM